MTFQEFEAQIMEKIGNFLPEEFMAERTVKIRSVDKSGVTYRGLYIVTGKSYETVPTLRLEPYYNEIQRNVPVDTVLKHLADDYLEYTKEAPNLDSKSVQDIFQADLLRAKLIPLHGNENYLNSGIAYEPYLDMAVVLTVTLPEYPNGHVTLHETHLSMMGMTFTEALKKAIDNMPEYTLRSMFDTVMQIADFKEQMGLGHLTDEEFREMMETMTNGDEQYVLMGQEVNGAAILLSEDAMLEIADKIGEFYVLPSSIHEVLLLPAETVNSRGLAVDDLATMVREVNNSEVIPEERLSYSVYHYDKTNGLTIAYDGSREFKRVYERD